MPAVSASAPAVAPVRSPFLTVLLAWIIPGAGHLFLGRRIRGLVLFATVLVSFAIGLAMKGPMFHVDAAGDMLSRLIQFGGFVGDVAVGLPYFLASFLGYAAPDVATHAADYGSKFLVAAGLFNVLAMVDAYEIATRQKE